MKIFQMLINLIVAGFCFMVGMCIFGWGLIGLAYVPTEKHLTIGTLIGVLLLAFLCYAFCGAAFWLIVSSVTKREFKTDVTLLFYAYLLFSALFTGCNSTMAMSQGRMTADAGNIIGTAALVLFMLIPSVSYLLNFLGKRRSRINNGYKE